MNNSYSVYTNCIRWLFKTPFKCVAYCIHTVMISEPIMFVSHPFKPACVKLSTSYRASEKWNQSALICHIWLGIFIFLFIHFARTLVLRVLRSLRRLLIMQLQSAKLSTLRWAQCSTLFHYPINRKPSQSPVLLLTRCHSPMLGLLLFAFFFSTELLHSPCAVYVGGIVK